MRIAELGSLHPQVNMTKKALVINSLSIARHAFGDKVLLPLFRPGDLASHFFDAELMEDEIDEPLVEPLESLTLGSLSRETRFSWYHPSPEMFLHNFLRMTNEEHNLDLVKLASYFADLLTGFSSSLSEFKSLPGHLAPSLIAMGSLAAAKQTLGLPETHWQDQVSTERVFSNF